MWCVRTIRLAAEQTALLQFGQQGFLRATRMAVPQELAIATVRDGQRCMLVAVARAATLPGAAAAPGTRIERVGDRLGVHQRIPSFWAIRSSAPRCLSEIHVRAPYFA